MTICNVYRELKSVARVLQKNEIRNWVIVRLIFSHLVNLKKSEKKK